ncbi:MAG TPA: hypothetical protein VI055_06380 [Rubrobacter sp.]|jgi:hypothetical protein
MSLRRLKQLQRSAKGRVGSFTLEDGRGYYYRPDRAAEALFVHGGAVRRARYLGDPLPEPPEILLAIAHARDRRTVVRELLGEFSPYDRDRLIEGGVLTLSQRHQEPV